VVVIDGFPKTGPRDSDRRLPMILGLLVAVSTLVGIGILTEPEPAGLPGDGLPRILETWVETYNSEQIDNLLALYTDDAVINGTLLQLDHDYIRAVHSLNMSWDETLSLSDCREVDVGVIRCDYLRSNDMLQRAGVTGSGLIEFGFDISGSIRRSDLIVVNAELIEFEGALSAWIEAEHPEVDLATRFGQVLLDDDSGDILVLVDEFVEQSEVYPLSG